MIEKKEHLSDISINEQGIISYELTSVFLEDGKEASRSFFRSSVTPSFTGDKTELPTLVQNAMEQTWTQEVIDAYNAATVDTPTGTPTENSDPA